jgi:pimeloyl-ACP methyl ester carboxylesterase
MPARTVGNASFYYEESGRGLPLVLLHGFPLDSRIWRKQRESLADSFHVITPDLRGFGKSQSNESFTMKSLADDVHAFLAEIGALPAVLGGLSMGGYVALEYVKKYPTDLRGLLLIDTRAEGDSTEGKQARTKMIELVKEKGPPAVAEQMMPKMLAPDSLKGKDDVVRELQQIMQSCPATTIINALLAMRDRTDHTSDLPSIGAETLIVVGEADSITPVASAEKMHTAIPNSQLTIIPKAGHMTSMEQPQALNDAIHSFITSLGPH